MLVVFSIYFYFHLTTLVIVNFICICHYHPIFMYVIVCIYAIFTTKCYLLKFLWLVGWCLWKACVSFHSFSLFIHLIYLLFACLWCCKLTNWIFITTNAHSSDIVEMTFNETLKFIAYSCMQSLMNVFFSKHDSTAMLFCYKMLK